MKYIVIHQEYCTPQASGSAAGLGSTCSGGNMSNSGNLHGGISGGSHTMASQQPATGSQNQVHTQQQSTIRHKVHRRKPSFSNEVNIRRSRIDRLVWYKNLVKRNNRDCRCILVASRRWPPLRPAPTWAEEADLNSFRD